MFPRGTVRLVVALGLVGAGIAATYLLGDCWLVLLKVIDFLVPKPGLSGLFLLGLLPFGFVLLSLLIEWVWRGYKGDVTERS